MFKSNKQASGAGMALARDRVVRDEVEASAATLLGKALGLDFILSAVKSSRRVRARDDMTDLLF